MQKKPSKLRTAICAALTLGAIGGSCAVIGAGITQKGPIDTSALQGQTIGCPDNKLGVVHINMFAPCNKKT